MTLEDFEKQLRATPLTKPDPSWRAQILVNCSPAKGYLWLKLCGTVVLLGLVSLSLHRWTNIDSVVEPSAIASKVDIVPGQSIIPGFEVKPGKAAFWDSILLKESDEVPTPKMRTWEVIEMLAQYQVVLDRFTIQIQQPNLTLPNPLPTARLRLTTEAFLWRAITRFDTGDSRGGVEACLALFPLIHLLGNSTDLKTAITQVGLIGITIFPMGKGIDFAANDDELRSLQEALQELRPLDSMIQAFGSWLKDNAAPKSEANHSYQAWIDAWDAEANGFRLEGSLELAENFGEPMPEETKRYRNVIPDTGRVEYRMRHAIIALMIERYRRVHGQVPDKLEDLVPHFSTTVLNSPWTGKPYDYEKIAVDNARMSSPRSFGNGTTELLLREIIEEE